MILAKMLPKCKEIGYSLTLFGIRHKGIFRLTAFTDSLQNETVAFESAFRRKALPTFSCQERKKCVEF